MEGIGEMFASLILMFVYDEAQFKDGMILLMPISLYMIGFPRPSPS